MLRDAWAADPVAVLTAGPCRRRVQRRVRANAGAVLIPRQC